jgi:hypothetical protein
MNADPVCHPAHYTAGGIETWDAIAAWGLDYFLGNAVKYLARAGKKDGCTEETDLKKSIMYLGKRMLMIEKGNRLARNHEADPLGSVRFFAHAKELPPETISALQAIVQATTVADGWLQTIYLATARSLIFRRLISLTRPRADE